MKILKSLTALLFTPHVQVQGSVVAYDGERVTLRLLDGREALIPLEAIPGRVVAHEVITARVSERDLTLVQK